MARFARNFLESWLGARKWAFWGRSEPIQRKQEHGHTKTGHVGETARYDWHGGNEMVLAELNDPGYTSKERVMPLLQHLQDISQDSCSDGENE